MHLLAHGSRGQPPGSTQPGSLLGAHTQGLGHGLLPQALGLSTEPLWDRGSRCWLPAEGHRLLPEAAPSTSKPGQTLPAPGAGPTSASATHLGNPLLLKGPRDWLRLTWVRTPS